MGRKKHPYVLGKFESNGDEFIELRISTGECVCIKKVDDLMIVLQCDDGKEVYDYVGGADFPLRELSITEHAALMEFARDKF